MVEIKACLFDLDGVLVDTAKYHYLAWKQLCNDLGFDLTEEENEALKGISREKSLEILLAKGGVELPQEERLLYMTRKNERYLEYVDAMHSDELLPGVRDFLKEVKASGRKIALGSASKNSMRILQKTEILPFFDAVIDGTKVKNGKPHPETFLLGAQELGLQPGSCVVFEDAAAGVEAGNAAGMFTIGVGSPEVLKDADFVIPGFGNVDINIFSSL